MVVELMRLLCANEPELCGVLSFAGLAPDKDICRACVCPSGCLGFPVDLYVMLSHVHRIICDG